MTTADDAAALLAEYAPKPKACKVKSYGHADIVDALHQQGASAHLMARILTERFNSPIVYNTILRHTRGQCGCPK